MKIRMLFNWNSSKLHRIFVLAPPRVTALGPGHVFRQGPRLQSECPPLFQGPAAMLNAAPRGLRAHVAPGRRWIRLVAGSLSSSPMRAQSVSTHRSGGCSGPPSSRVAGPQRRAKSRGLDDCNRVDAESSQYPPNSGCQSPARTLTVLISSSRIDKR